MKLTQKQIDFLNNHTKGSWFLNSKNGLVDVKGNFDCSCRKFKSLQGVKFGKVSGDFYCPGNSIKKELLQMIWERMKGGIPYFIALHSLKKEIEDFKKESQDKKSYDLLLNQIVDEKLAKGACLLNKF